MIDWSGWDRKWTFIPGKGLSQNKNRRLSKETIFEGASKICQKKRHECFLNVKYDSKKGVAMKKIILFAFIAPLLFFPITSCSISSDSDPTIAPPTWDTIDSWVRFTTNDENYYNYLYWYWYNNTDNYPVTIQVKKVSGSASTAFGIIFCHQDDGSFYSVQITTNGSYRFRGRNSSGDWIPIQDWTNNTNIVNTGYNSVNTVTISYSDPIYTITLNEINLSFNRASAGLNLVGGEAGFIAYISDSTHENFPDEAEDVRFKITSPITIP